MSGRQDVREANIHAVGNWRMPVLGDLNARLISLEEVCQVVNEIKSGNLQRWMDFRRNVKERWYGSDIELMF